MVEMFHERGGGLFFIVSRVVVGLLFAMKGMQKLFGLFGGERVSLTSVMGAVGLLQFICGLVMAAGIMTLIIALVGAVLSIFVYVTVNMPQGLLPLTNNGEVTLLYFAAFMCILAYQLKTFGFSMAFWRRFRH